MAKRRTNSFKPLGDGLVFLTAPIQVTVPRDILARIAAMTFEADIYGF